MENLDTIVGAIAKNYSTPEIFFTDPDKHFPNKKAIIGIIKDIRRVMFPRYFGDETPTGTNPEYFIGETLIRIEDALRKQLYEALAFRCARDNEDPQRCTACEEEVDARVDEICKNFFEKLPRFNECFLPMFRQHSMATPQLKAKKKSYFPTQDFLPFSYIALLMNCTCSKSPSFPAL